jgi:SAM-dependent methyltransferase
VLSNLPNREAVSGESRALYHQFAWAYDLLFDEDVAPFVGAVTETLPTHGVQRGSRILDAGCGTGRYAVELARRGFIVEGVDASPELVAYARQHNVPDGMSVGLSIGDLRNLSASKSFDAVICRGVLNDILDEQDRQAVVERLASSLRTAGVLVLDVRDWFRTTTSVRERPLFEKVVPTGDSTLTFRSAREIDHVDRLVISHEELSAGAQRAHSTFRMRPWSEPELRTALELAGCHVVTVAHGSRVRGDHTISDRILATAVRG